MSPQLLYLSRADVEKVALPMSKVIDLVEAGFREKGLGDVEMPPKPGIHTRKDAFIHAMPAYIPAMDSAGIKWVGGYPENYKKGLPYISGLLILNDPETGLPVSVMDCSWITAMRTGSAGAVAARYLARPDSEVMGVLGCGVQGRTNLIAMSHLFPIKRVYAYDIRPEAAEKYRQEMGESLGVEVVVVKEPKDAVADADIVVTAGPILKHPTPVIEKGWLKPGGFASPVDFDSYWKPEALAEADKYATDDTSQYLYYRTVGYFLQSPDPYADLGEIVTGQKPGRETPEERTISMNLGLALEDMAVAPEIYRLAKEQGIGTWLPL